MNVLSLFDGISCGMIALEKAGIKVDKYYASEIKKDAIQVSEENYPNIIRIGDVTKVTKQMVGDIDLLIGGSPCQSFSIAGKREGFEGESGLFYEYARILKEVKPRYFLLENVRMKKEWQDTISQELGVEPININSKLLSGQLRNRFYWTNIKGITQPNKKDIYLQDILEYGYTNREKSRCLMAGDSRPNTNPLKMFHRYFSTGFSTLIFKDKTHYEQCKKHYDNYFKGLSAKQINVRLENENIDTSVYEGVRYLNQKELEILQTLPQGYTKCLTRNKSAGCIGDGWTVDVIAHIFSFIKDNEKTSNKLEKYSKSTE